MTESEWLARDDPVEMLQFVTGFRDGDSWGIGHHCPNDRKLRLFAIACCRLYDDPEVSLEERGRWDNAELFVDDKYKLPHNVGNTLISRGPDWIAQWAAKMEFIRLGQTPDKKSKEKAVLLREIVGNPFRPQPLLTRSVSCDRCNGKGQRTIGRACGACDGSGRTKGNADWLTPTVLDLAEAAYSQRLADGTLDPHRLAVLSDALEEAGCDGECASCGGRRYVSAFWPDKRPSDMTVGDPGRRCPDCGGTGRVPSPLLAHLRSPGPHVRGCFALDLILRKE